MLFADSKDVGKHCVSFGWLKIGAVGHFPNQTWPFLRGVGGHGGQGVTFNAARDEKRPSLLQLGQGSVVELAKFAGEPLELLVNDKLIARGEVVVVNEKFGLRLTDIISPVERIEQLK